MKLIKVDPRALTENPDPTRRTKSTPQSDALLLATVKAVGIIQPPIVTAQRGRGNGFTIEIGHRRVAQAIAAKLDEIEVLVADPDEEKDALRSLIENVAREPLNPVDLWRRIERLVALGWTEESIGIALGQSVRQIRKLRLLANILPAMLDHIAKGDMPSEQYLRTIAAATQDEQAQVWKKYKPRKTDPQVTWSEVARALTKTRMFARHASFGDELAQAYGILWQEDLFAPADEDSRYTNDVEAFLGAQQEWMTANLPKRGFVIEVTTWGEPKLPPKAERVYGKPNKSDYTGWYLDPRNGSVQSVAYRMPQAKKDAAKGKGSRTAESESVAPAPRPDVTRRGMDMIGDLRTDALHEALGRAPIEDDTLTALLDDHEAAALEAMETADAAESRLAKGHAALERARAEVEARAAEVRREGQAVTQRGRDLIQRRAALAAEFPASLLALYEQARERNGGIGAARLVGRRSQASGTELSPADVARIEALPPAAVAMPFKIIFFVLVDGWHLISGTLVQSFGTIS